MTFALTHAWLVPAIPFFSFLVVGLLLRPISRAASGWFATFSVIASAAFAYMIAWDYFHLSGGGHFGTRPALVPWSFEWLKFQEGLAVSVGVLLDPISILLMVVVTTVSALVHLYSIAYMRGEQGFGRYFTWLNLFTFSMLGLVCSPNIVQMYVCWELVGASSFLLIGYYYEKPAAVAASKKAFVVTRFADLGFLLGVLVLGYFARSFDFTYLTGSTFLQQMPPLLLTLSMLLVFMGAAGKSAMFPLHIWLPDAMEGPTPVSALIHAATMVVAGVYLVARLFPVFAASGLALDVVAYVGAFTSLFAAMIGCTQSDIKRVLAFSTLSQLGYMMFSLGVATMEHPLGYSASMFHLFTHAFFKALLFLGAGALIHAVHSNNLWEMGGLRKKMPVTHLTMLIATLSIAGIWPFSGFFSKDEILVSALESGHRAIFAVGLIVAGITAFYMFRVYFLVFSGERRASQSPAHEAPVLMLVPLVVLALLSLGAGWVPMNSLLGTQSTHSSINWAAAGPGLVAAALGIAAAWFLYAGTHVRVQSISQSLGGVYRTIQQKFYFDEIYLFVTKRVVFRFVAVPIAWFDRNVVDGGVNLTGWATRAWGALLSRLQTGQVQTYGTWFVFGSVIMLFVFVLLQR